MKWLELEWLPERWATWSFRVGAYLLINLLDDPAWLAFMFC